MNEWIAQELVSGGFLREVPVGPQVRVDQRLDFAARLACGNRLAIEIEFGNLARFDSDLIKFMTARSCGQSVMGALACPVSQTAKQITGGGITFEAARDRLMEFPSDIPLGPVWLIGLDQYHAELVDLSNSKIGSPDLLSNNNGPAVIQSVVQQYREGTPVSKISVKGLPGRKPVLRRSAPEVQGVLFK